MIPEDKQQVLREIVETYLSAEGLIPKGLRLNMLLTLVPTEPIVTIVDQMADYDPQVLGLKAVDSFREFFARNGKKYTRVESCLIISFCEDPTIHDVVSRGNKCDKAWEVDLEWLKYRNLGRKALNIIDEWLASLNLRRGMKL